MRFLILCLGVFCLGLLFKSVYGKYKSHIDYKQAEALREEAKLKNEVDEILNEASDFAQKGKNNDK